MVKHKDLVILVVLCLMIFQVLVADEQESVVGKVKKTVFSVRTISSTYWERAKLMVQHGHAHLFPLTLEGSEEGGGAGQKVTAAVSKSIGKSKSTVEESAKTAAKFAEMTTDKIKKTFTPPKSDQESTQEL